MTTTLAELLTPRTAEQELTTLLSLLVARGFPISDYLPGSAPAVHLEAVAAAIAEHAAKVAEVARGGFLDLAQGAWLDLVAAGSYGLTRAPATSTRQACIVSCAPGLGPQVVNAGFTVRSLAGNLYRYAGEPVSVPDGGSTPAIEFAAEAPGARFADAAGTILQTITSLSGLSVVNVAITKQGADVESDRSLAERCRGRWPSLSRNHTAGSIENLLRFYAIENEIGIDKLLIRPSGTVAGRTDVLLATVTGSPSVESLAALQLFMDGQMGATESISVRGATNRTVTATGTVYTRAADLASIKAAVDVAWPAYLARVPIGGDTSTGASGVVRLAELVEAVMAAGAIDYSGLQLNGVAANLAISAEQVAIVVQPLSASLTWVTL